MLRLSQGFWVPHQRGIKLLWELLGGDLRHCTGLLCASIYNYLANVNSSH